MSEKLLLLLLLAATTAMATATALPVARCSLPASYANLHITVHGGDALVDAATQRFMITSNNRRKQQQPQQQHQQQQQETLTNNDRQAGRVQVEDEAGSWKLPTPDEVLPAPI